MSERARALEQALRELTAMVRGECPSLLNEDSGGNGDLSCQIEKLLAVDPPPSGASPQATGGYIHHSLTDWIPTPECDCDRCTSARKSAPKPTGGASPQAETSEDEDDAPAVDSWSAPLRKPVVPKILSTDDFYALLRIIEVLPVADPFLTDLQSKLSAEERRQHGNRASHLSGPEFVREIERIEALIQSRLPAPVSPVEPESSSFEANTASNLLQKVELSTLDRYRNTNQMDVDTWMVRAVASSEPRSEDDLVLLDHVIALLKPTVEPEPPAEAQFGEYERLKRQAREIEKALREAGCPAMPLEQGVRWLADKDFTTPLPPRPPAVVKPHRYDLVRYGVTWEGQDNQPLLTPMPDGYWTPWHLAVEAPTVEPEPCVWREKYNELLFAVARAYPGESRHETALRYIREKETVEACGPKAPLKVEREQSDEQPSEISAVPHKPVVNLMEALKKSLESLDRARKP